MFKDLVNEFKSSKFLLAGFYVTMFLFVITLGLQFTTNLVFQIVSLIMFLVSGFSTLSVLFFNLTFKD